MYCYSAFQWDDLHYHPLGLVSSSLHSSLLQVSVSKLLDLSYLQALLHSCCVTQPLCRCFDHLYGDDDALSGPLVNHGLRLQPHAGRVLPEQLW